MACDVCRQVMQELMPHQEKVHIDGVGARLLMELLPDVFALGSKEDENAP